MAGAKHHVIDFLDPLEKCTVVDFRNKVRLENGNQDII